MIKDSEIESWKASGTYVSTTKANGLKVFTKEVGNASASPEKTLLLLHGFPESSFSYHLVLAGLTEHFERIILLDFPGFGFSDKPQKGYAYTLLNQADVALEVWKHYAVTGGHLLAHDMGDSVATELVAREVENSLPDWFSDGFQSYTLTNGSMVLGLADLRITQKLLLTPLGPLLSKLISEKLFHHQIKGANGDAPLEDLEVARLWEMNIQNEGRKVSHLTIKYLLDRKRYETPRWLPALSKTSIPIHLCWGNKDNVARVEMAHYLKKEVCPQAQLSIMEDTGHFGQLGSPETWLQSVLAYYQKIRSS